MASSYQHMDKFIFATPTGAWNKDTQRVFLEDGFEAYRHEVIQLLRLCIGSRVEHGMHINSKGNLLSPMELNLLRLPLVFVVFVLLGPLIALWAGICLLFGLTYAGTETSTALSNKATVLICTVALTASLHAPIFPLTLQVLAGQNCEGVHSTTSVCPLHAMFDKNLVSGVEVFVPLVFPLFVAYWATVETLERIIAKQLLYQVAEEFNELDMYSGRSNTEGETLMSTSPSASVQTGKAFKRLSTRDIASSLFTATAKRNPNRPLGKTSSVDGTEKFSADWLARFIAHLDRHLSCPGGQVFGDDPVLLTETDLDVDADGENYAEQWAAHWTTKSHLRKESGIGMGWELFVNALGLIVALTPFCWMSWYYPEQYLTGGDYAYIAKIDAFVSAVCLFSGIRVTFHACVVRLNCIPQIRLQWHVLLYLCSTDTSRRQVFRTGRSLLQDLEIEHVPLVHIDPHLRGMAVEGQTMHGDVEKATDKWKELIQVMRQKWLSGIAESIFFCVESDPGKTPTPEAETDVLQGIEFELLDPMVFSYLRMWLKLGTTFASKRIQNVIPLVLIMSLVGLLLDEGAVFFWNYIVCSTLIVVVVTAFFLTFLFCCIHQAVRLNLALKEFSVTMLIEWKELLRKIERQRFDAADETMQGGQLTGTWLRLQSYFEGLFSQIQHVVEQVERAEAPISFLGIVLTVDWLTRVIAIVATTVLFSLWHLIRQKEHAFIQLILDKVTKHSANLPERS